MKKTLKATKRYEVTFNKPEYNAVYEFERGESGAFAYGNQTSVTVFKGEKFIGVVDTRYDNSVMRDFGAWCMDYLANMFDPAYEPKFKEV